MADVTITHAAPLKRYSLRARDAGALEKLLGIAIPRKIGETLDMAKGGDVACLGPDEWLLRSADFMPRDWGAGQPLSIVDISDRSASIVIDGPDAAQVLASGCPLDLERFPVGRATRTIYESVEIIIWRESETRFSVDVWRSFAEWLWLSLTTAAEHP